MDVIQTPPSRRNYRVAVVVGVIAGLLSGVVKLGWEVLLPPRTPARDATNPPQELLQQLGISHHVTHLTYTYSDQSKPWVSFIIHFSFSIAVAIFYCVVAERFPQIKLWQGVAFGLLVWFGFHIVIMPAMGTIPAPWHQPPDELISEFFGHAIWFWAAEITRRDMRNRITHQPDPEVPLAAATE